jgi:hypothetical protein
LYIATTVDLFFQFSQEEGVGEYYPLVTAYASDGSITLFLKKDLTLGLFGRVSSMSKTDSNVTLLVKQIVWRS